MLDNSVAHRSIHTTEKQDSFPDPKRFPSIAHRVKIRSLSGRFAVFPVQSTRLASEAAEGRQAVAEGAEDAARQSDAPMGSSDVHICRNDATNPNARAPRGFNGLPKAGKELIVDGTALLHQIFKSLKVQSVCWTITQPSSFADGTPFQKDDYKRWLRGQSDFTRWVMEELGRELTRLGLPNRWLYVIEPQEERWRVYGVLAPHIHAVIPNRWIPTKQNPHKDKGFGASGYWALTIEDLDDIIARCAARVMGRAVDCRSAGNVDKIHGLGKVGQYMSKFDKIGNYFSKGSRIMKDIQESEWSGYIPSNWYGSDKETRQQVRSSVEVHELGEGSLFQAAAAIAAFNEVYESETGKPMFACVHTHWIRKNGERVPYGEPVPEDAFPVAMTGRINHLRDIEIGTMVLQAMELNTIPIPLEHLDSSY